MPAFSASSPGKIILFGEHAVVYGEPALAVPVQTLQARVIVQAVISGTSGEIWIEAPDIDLYAFLDDLSGDHPLRAAVAAVAGEEKLDRIPACRVQIISTIPPSSGLGSSAAVSAAVIRAFSAFLGKRLSDREISDLTFEVEKIYHGTPSGIDNSVVVFQKPVYFQKGSPLQFLAIGSPFEILIADSGIAGDTGKAVAAVRDKWLADQEDCGRIFTGIGRLTRKAKDLITSGNPLGLGPLMVQNQAYLRELGVSSPELDRLADRALQAGALGAKLSGGGLGGHLIALPGENVEGVRQALLDGGAKSVLLTTVQG